MAAPSTPPWVSLQAETIRTRPTGQAATPLHRTLFSRILSGLSSAGSSASSTASSLLQQLSPILMQRLPGLLGQQATVVPDSPLVYIPREGSSMTPAAAKTAAKSILRKSRNDKKAFADDDDDDSEVCSICLRPCEHIDNGDPTAVLECGHFYHVACFKEWAERDNFTCPLCRSCLAVEDSFALSPVNGILSPLGSGAAPRPSKSTPHAEASCVVTTSSCAIAPPGPPLDALSYRELQERAKACGLRATGKREALLAALTEHQAARGGP